MKIIRSILLEAISLYILTQLLPGFIVFGGMQTYIIGGAVLWLLSITLKPALNFVAAPFYLITFGLVSIITHALIFFILTKLLHSIQIKSFTLASISIFGVVIPRFNFNLLEAFLIVAATQIMIKWIILWIAKE